MAKLGCKRGIHTLIKCIDCNKLTINEGFLRCSKCYKSFKRKTDPISYLLSTYREMKRRVKRYNPARPNYYKLEICNRDEFLMKFKNDPSFLNIYRNWQVHDYKRGLAPSIDRIDGSIGYLIDNLQFLTNSENFLKERRNPIRLNNNESTVDFISQVDAAKFLQISYKLFFYYKKFKGIYNGWTITEL